MITITLRYFASLREQIGRSQETLTLADSITVLDVWQYVHQTPLPDNTLIAVNMEYVERIHYICNGDEVAFFPPVTGG